MQAIPQEMTPHKEHVGFQEETLSKTDIKGLIPHRWPMFMLYEASYSPEMPNILIATKKIRYWDLFLFGHFPGNKIYPGVLLLETIAQSAAVLVRKKFPDSKGLPHLRESSIKFLKPVLPGDKLIIQTELIRERLDKLYIFNGSIRNQRDELVCEALELKGIPG